MTVRLTPADLARLTGARPRQGKSKPRGKRGRPEALLLRQCLAWLAAKGIWAQRLNAGAIQLAGRRVSLGAAGTPDLLILARPRLHPHFWALPIFVELKSPGGRLRPSQRSWAERAEAAGAVVLVIRSLPELEDALRAEGVIP